MKTAPGVVIAVSILVLLGGIPVSSAGVPTSPSSSDNAASPVSTNETQVAAPSPETFGYGSMTVDGQPAEGERPLLVVLVEYDDVSFDDANPPEDIEALFAESRRYFTENSYGAFTWDPTVVGPFTHPDDDSTDDIDESLFNCAKVRKPQNGSGGCPGADTGWYDNHSSEEQLTAAIQLAESEGGVDFAAYDTNDDGRVSPDELTIAIVTAEPAAPTDDIPVVSMGGGAARTADPDNCVETDDVSVCTISRGGYDKAQAGAVMLNEWTQFTTVAHELSHTLGTFDLYGANARLNSDVTLMDATIGEDKRYHLDAWHKIQLGWVEPRIYRMDERWDDPQCLAMAPTHERAPLPEPDARRPVILYSPLRYDTDSRTGEFYLLEHRERDGFDVDLPSDGLALWYVSLEDGEPKPLPSTIAPGGGRTELETEPRGDDVNTTVDGEEQIHAGPNGLLDSSVATDENGENLDSVKGDRLVLHVSPGMLEGGAPTNYSLRVTGRLWQAFDGDVQPTWFDRDVSGPPFSVAGRDRDGNLLVDLNTRVLEIDSPSATWDIEDQEPIVLTGYFGHNGTASGDERVVRVIGGIDETIDGARLDWSCGRVEATPFFFPPGIYQLFVEDPENGATSNRIDLVVRRGVSDGGWRGTYTGSLDGRTAQLTIRSRPGDEFTDEVELVDEDRGITYTGTLERPSTNGVASLELSSGSGETLTVDLLVVDLESHDHLAGLVSSADGSSQGVAFSDAANWTSSSGAALATEDPETWVDQWTGSYSGYLDGRPATLIVSGGELVEFGTLRPGEGYRFEIELVDDRHGIKYHGSGVIDATGGRTNPHILEVSEMTAAEGYTSPYDRYEQLNDVQFRLHAADTSRISGVAMVGEHSPGYGPKAIPYAFHFRQGSGLVVSTELTSTITAIETDDIPWFARPVVRGERVNLHLPDGTFGVETGKDGTPRTVQRTAFEDPTVDVYVSQQAIDDIRGADDRQEAVLSAVRSGDIRYETTSVFGQLKYGAVRLAVDIYAVGQGFVRGISNVF